MMTQATCNHRTQFVAVIVRCMQEHIIVIHRRVYTLCSHNEYGHTNHHQGKGFFPAVIPTISVPKQSI